MSVEIRELIIRAVVTGGEDEAEGAAATTLSAAERQEIIAESVRQVLKILKKAQER